MVLPESGKTKTPWLETKRLEFPKLEGKASCDVLVIGAGISGLSCAYMLVKEGKHVIVVDSGRMCSGETQRTTAHLCDQIDDSYQEITRIYGTENANLIRESLAASIDTIEQIVNEENIDCDFERLDGYLFEGDDSQLDLKKEREAGLEAGLPEIESIDALDLISGSPAALRYPRQGQIHSVKYLNGLCKALAKMNVQIYQESRVEKIDNKGKKKEQPQAVLVNKSTIDAADIIVATNGPIIDFSIQTKQVAYRSFAIAMVVPTNKVRKALYWDTEEPYHYVRLQSIEGNSTEKLLIVGGEDHRVGEKNDAEERFERLIAWTREKFAVDGEIAYRWSGQVYEPTDGLGFIGEDPELGKHVYVVTGDSGMGITNGTVAGLLLTDLILGRENSWEKVYSPARQTPKALGNYLGETVRSLSHYSDLILAKTVDKNEILNGEGALIEEDGKKVAAYRHQSGEVSTVSAYCTHMKGVVCWNSCESSWDCPVHGSRFMATGEVIYGPADGDLEPTK